MSIETSEARDGPMKNPPHPGRIIRRDCIEALGLKMAEAATALGVSRQTLDRVVNERSAVTPEMALKLSKAFGSSAETWMRLQTAYDLAQVRLREAEITAHVHPVGAAPSADIGGA